MPLLVGCLFGTAVAYLVTGTADTLFVLVLGRVLARTFKQTTDVAKAFLADLTTSDDRVQTLLHICCCAGTYAVYHASCAAAYTLAPMQCITHNSVLYIYPSAVSHYQMASYAQQQICSSQCATCAEGTLMVGYVRVMSYLYAASGLGFMVGPAAGGLLGNYWSLLPFLLSSAIYVVNGANSLLSQSLCLLSLLFIIRANWEIMCQTASCLSSLHMSIITYHRSSISKHFFCMVCLSELLPHSG